MITDIGATFIMHKLHQNRNAIDCGEVDGMKSTLHWTAFVTALHTSRSMGPPALHRDTLPFLLGDLYEGVAVAPRVRPHLKTLRSSTVAAAVVQHLG